MSKPFPYGDVEEIIGYTFQNKDLLIEAFTHSTYANKHGGKDNERLEYLGDTVLQLVVTEWQFLNNREAQEGVLTKERQTLVCEEALFEAVERLGIAKYLRVVGKAENIGRKTISSIFETLVAAVYLDGGYEAAKAFIYQHAGLKQTTEKKNPKSVLQEYLQSMGWEVPKYVCEKSGKDNAPIFVCEATVDTFSAKGVGGSKKAAEQEAAEMLYEMLTKAVRTTQNGKRKK
jgi:ribonuclease-3